MQPWKLLLVSLFALLAVGCTDAKRASWAAYDSSASILCYSGGEVVYDGRSSGRIATVEGSDGWEFQEEGSGDFIRVSGACVIRN